MTATGRVSIDDIDRRIIDLLIEDGRLSVNELAVRANLARATAYARLDRLRRTGVITGFTAIVDHDKLGDDISALILINIEQGSWATLRSDLLAIPGVEQLVFTSGVFDVVLTVRVSSIASLRDVVLNRLHRIDGVKSTQTIFALDQQRVVHHW